MTTTWGGQPAVFTAVDAVCGSLALALDSSLLSVGGSGVTDLLRHAYAARSQVEALILVGLVHAETVGAYTRLGQRSMKGWLRRQFLMSNREATRLLDLAAKLRRCEQTTNALTKGIVSVEAAAIIATAISNLPAEAGPEARADAETAMLDQTDTLEPEQLVVFGKRLAELLTTRPDEDDPNEKAKLRDEEKRADRTAYEQRNITLTQRPDGSLRISGLLPAEQAAAVRHMLEHLAKPSKSDDGLTDDRSLGQRLADAFVQIVRTSPLADGTDGTHSDDDSNGNSDDDSDADNSDADNSDVDSSDGDHSAHGDIAAGDAGWGDIPVDPYQPTLDNIPGRPGEQNNTATRSADGYRHTGAAFQRPSSGSSSPAGCPHCPFNEGQREESQKSKAKGNGKFRPGRGGVVPYQVSVVLDYDKLMNELPGAGMLDDGTILPTSSLLRILCDAEIIPVVLDGRSLPLHLGRRRRRFSPAQHTALAARDLGCAWPGCQRPARACEAHHCKTWTKDKGSTDITNGALLCLAHHQQVHREGWIVRLAANGYPEFIPPQDFDPERRPRQHYRYRAKARTG